MGLERLGSSLRGLFSKPKPTGRSLQIRLDAGRVYNLLQLSGARERSMQPFANPDEPDSETRGEEEDLFIAGRLGLPSLPSIQIQSGAIKQHTVHSVKKILHHTYSAMIESSATRQGRSIQALMKGGFSYVPVIGPSGIPDAGRGVFVDGMARAGSVVSIYPGTSYLPSQLRKLQSENSDSGSNSEGESNSDSESKTDSYRDNRTSERTVHLDLDLSDYMIARYDGIIIDGAKEVEIDLADMEDSVNNVHDTERLQEHLLHNNSQSNNNFHPFANAHLVNHPPPNSETNVLQFMVDVDIFSLGGKLAPLMPIRPCEIPVTRFDNYENQTNRNRVKECSLFTLDHLPAERVFKSIVLIALRDIQDEELFMNYRFNPKVKHPDWYTPVHEGHDASRRWFPRGVFR